MGQRDQCGFDLPFRLQPVPLQLDVETVTENLRKTVERPFRLLVLPFEQQPSDRAVYPAGQGDQPVGTVREPVDRNLGLLAAVSVKERAAAQVEKVAVSGLRGGQHVQAVRRHRSRLGGRHPTVAGPFPAYAQGQADNRLDPGLAGGDGELERAEQVAGVGDRNRGHAVLLAPGDQLLHPERTLRERIGGPNGQVNEFRVRHRFPPPGSRSVRWPSCSIAAAGRDSVRTCTVSPRTPCLPEQDRPRQVFRVPADACVGRSGNSPRRRGRRARPSGRRAAANQAPSSCGESTTRPSYSSTTRSIRRARSRLWVATSAEMPVSAMIC